jgi:hypothetical protein
VTSMGAAKFFGDKKDASLPWDSYISNLQCYIVDNSLDNQGAYSLAASALGGHLLDACLTSLKQGVSFPHWFPLLQAMGTKYYSPTAINDEINRLRSKPPQSIASVMSALSGLHVKLHAHLPPAEKLQNCITDFRSDLTFLLRTYWPFLLSPIMEKDEELRNAYHVEKAMLTRMKQDLSNMQNVYHPMSSILLLSISKTSNIPALGYKAGFQLRDADRRPRDGHVHAMSVEHDDGRREGAREQRRPQQGGGVRRSSAQVASMQAQPGGYRGGGSGRPRQPNNRGAQGPSGSNKRPLTGRDPPRDRSTGRWLPRSGGNRPDRTQEYSPFPRRTERDVHALVTKPGGVTPVRCGNCNMLYHRADQCFRYNKAAPGSRVCASCRGRHTGPCLKGRQRNINALATSDN